MQMPNKRFPILIMTKSVIRTGLFSILFLSVTAVLGAQSAEQLIQKARARLGTEAALNGVNGLLFEGTVKQYVYENEGAQAVQSDGSIRVVIQKPDQRRIEIKNAQLDDVGVINGYTGWRTVQRKGADAPASPDLVNLNASVILVSRIEVAEALNFFRATELLDGTVKDLGTKEWKKLPARVLRFDYGNIYYDRYFDAGSGKLLGTIASYGIEIVEEGETVVNGVRFPQKVAYFNNGRLVREDIYSKIEVNPAVKPEQFQNPTSEVLHEGMKRATAASQGRR